MLSAFVKVQRWWGHAPTPSVGDRVPFEIVCTCGQRHQGWRQPTHQIVLCTACRRRRFVLPLSPLPRVSAPDTRAPTPAVVSAGSRRMNPWLGPLIGAGATLLCVIGIFAALLVFVLPPRGDRAVAPVAIEQVENHIAAGQQALSDGDFAQAATAFGAAEQQLKRSPALLPANRVRELAQLRRQTELMADWPGERLELELARAAVLSDNNWQTVANSYRGRSLTFDGTLRRDASGQLHATRLPPVEGQTFRVQLQSLKLLKRLPLSEPERVILLARLAKVRREAPGVCALELDPESGVLLTDKRVAKRCGCAILDADVERVLERQQRWVRELVPEP